MEQIAQIQEDIYKLRLEQIKRRENIKVLRSGIDDLYFEQKELKQYLNKEIENKFNPEALKVNINRIDWQVEQIEATIRKEEAGINQLDQIINKLEERKCQLEVTFQ